MTRSRQKKKQEVSGLLRQPIESIFDILVELNPQLETRATMKFPAAMMFLGMINWTHTWFASDGELSTEAFAKLLCDTFVNGFSNIDMK